MNNYNTYTYSYTNNFMIINKIFTELNIFIKYYK